MAWRGAGGGSGSGPREGDDGQRRGIGALARGEGGGPHGGSGSEWPSTKVLMPTNCAPRLLLGLNLASTGL
ncbi:hypothetical protein [Oryza sativa Japonica Group]|uniref:Uncharacterized protein n=1 Tax=Oryza sativa subsp. japonica TaxID=39947 RepID=Q5JMC5_ORYSJ|nr:hypothetical protein [Oryza sativa Japonica Group]